MVNKLFDYFQTKVYIPRVKRGKRQELESLINEEAFLISRYLRLKGEAGLLGFLSRDWNDINSSQESL
jgi:hypothetical protein